MNDAQIRKSFHQKKLWRHHENPDTVVVDELGLKHGKCRADIAVINGHLIGYEIKSDVDSLRRLTDQTQVYSNVFDCVAVVLGENHTREAKKCIPSWWGIIVAKEGMKGAINFEILRQKKFNPHVDDYSVAQLLWHNEAYNALLKIGITENIRNKKRSILYRIIVDSLSSSELRRTVRECLRNRVAWRRPETLSLNDDLYRRVAK